MRRCAQSVWIVVGAAYLAAGFAVAMAPAMLRYLRYAPAERIQQALEQRTAVTRCAQLLLSLESDAWLEVDDRWNCLAGAKFPALLALGST
jgi:hypothetical protein